MYASFYQTLDGAWDELEEYERIRRRARRISDSPDVNFGREFLEAVVPDDQKKYIPSKEQIGAGARAHYSAKRALAIGATLAAMDGPLPVGDVIAVAFWTGVAIYNTGIALDWW